jgi:hypothetical protein
MGKKKGSVWKHWTILVEEDNENNESNKPHPRVKCNYCSKIFDRGIATRMQVHLDKDCTSAPDNAKSKQKKNNDQSNTDINTFVSTINHPQKKRRTTTIDNFVDRVSGEEQEKLEFMLAKTIFAAGVPFTFVENPYFINFIQHIRPSFKLPNRRKLASDLLDKVFDEVKEESDKEILSAQNLCMVSDGWSNINQESVQNFIVCTPKPFFFDATYSGEESHTAVWIASEIIKQMEIIDIKKFSAVITDTASVMKAAWRIIEQKYPNIICFGCISHIMNLLIKDIIKIHEIKFIVDDAKDITKYFKSHTQSMAKFKRIQCENYGKEISLILPVLTRWGTHLKCLQSLQKSRIAIEQTLMDSKIRQNMDYNLRARILNEEFWEKLEMVISILKPIVITLKLFESDSSTLSSVYSNFEKIIKIIQEIPCNFNSQIQKLIQERWKYAYHETMAIAYMLDPIFLEESRDIEAAGYNEFTSYTNSKFSHEDSVELFVELVKFRNKNSPYDNDIIWKSATILNSSMWWKSWPNSKLQQIAIRILSIPTSSAAAERNFSTFGFIHNKIRNRLHNNRVKKLVYIYANLRIHINNEIGDKIGNENHENYDEGIDVNDEIDEDNFNENNFDNDILENINNDILEIIDDDILENFELLDNE